MSTHKKIAWESWNAMVQEINQITPVVFDIGEEEEPSSFEQMEKSGEVNEIFIQQPKFVYTPLGIYPAESTFKPSDRWDCWIGYTNFGVTKNIAKVLDTEIEGIECLKILGKYSFFVGVGKLFDITDVRQTIETALCAYTEKEILSDEDTQTTVDLVKEQLSTKKYWSMLVSPEGKVEYVVSDNMDKVYLDVLNSLLELKQSIGGIILRGQNG